MFSDNSGFLTHLPLLLSGIKIVSFFFHIVGIVHCPPFPDTFVGGGGVGVVVVGGGGGGDGGGGGGGGGGGLVWFGLVWFCFALFVAALLCPGKESLIPACVLPSQSCQSRVIQPFHSELSGSQLQNFQSGDFTLMKGFR
jgi:hypothetical protein